MTKWCQITIESMLPKPIVIKRQSIKYFNLNDAHEQIAPFSRILSKFIVPEALKRVHM